MDIVLGFFDGLPAWLHAVTSVVVASTAITALPPSKSDDKVLNVILKVLNTVSGNVLKNKNADS